VPPRKGRRWVQAAPAAELPAAEPTLPLPPLLPPLKQPLLRRRAHRPPPAARAAAAPGPAAAPTPPPCRSAAGAAPRRAGAAAAAGPARMRRQRCRCPLISRAGRSHTSERQRLGKHPLMRGASGGARQRVKARAAGSGWTLQLKLRSHRLMERKLVTGRPDCMVQANQSNN
jgi:hypothetical protein